MKARTSRARTRSPKHSTQRPSRKIIVELPAQLYAEAEKLTEQLSTNRSALIRSALQEYLEKWRRQELENELAEGYIANASQALETAEDFIHVDSELL
jgi:metal-responsive CopG/Arc/MetJ family transcriptional regulator